MGRERGDRQAVASDEYGKGMEDVRKAESRYHVESTKEEADVGKKIGR